MMCFFALITCHQARLATRPYSLTFHPSRIARGFKVVKRRVTTTKNTHLQCVFFGAKVQLRKSAWT
jgi:hypothetical protein